jgi:hypothetical protein
MPCNIYCAVNEIDASKFFAEDGYPHKQFY